MDADKREGTATTCTDDDLRVAFRQGVKRGREVGRGSLAMLLTLMEDSRMEFDKATEKLESTVVALEAENKSLKDHVKDLQRGMPGGDKK